MGRGDWLVAASAAALSAVAMRGHWQRALAPLFGAPASQPVRAIEVAFEPEPTPHLGPALEAPAAPVALPSPAPQAASMRLPARPKAPEPTFVSRYGLISFRPPPAPRRAALAFADDVAGPPPWRPPAPRELFSRVDTELLGNIVGTLGEAYPVAASSSLDAAGESYVRGHADDAPPSPQRLALLMWPLVEALGMQGRIDPDSGGVTLLTTACPLLDTVPGERRASVCELVCGEHASLLRGAAAAGGATLRAPSRMGDGAPFCMRRLAMTEAAAK